MHWAEFSSAPRWEGAMEMGRIRSYRACLLLAAVTWEVAAKGDNAASPAALKRTPAATPSASPTADVTANLPSKPYDCKAGPSNSAEEWPPAKVLWCKKHRPSKGAPVVQSLSASAQCDTQCMFDKVCDLQISDSVGCKPSISREGRFLRIGAQVCARVLPNLWQLYLGRFDLHAHFEHNPCNDRDRSYHQWGSTSSNNAITSFRL